MGGDGFDVDVDALRGAASGIGKTLHDREVCEIRGVCGDAEQYGSDAVHGAFADFCGRWQYGVEVLLDDAEGIRDALGRAASAYQATDEGMRDPLQGAARAMGEA
ncbi:hypothetical protein SAMN05216266_1514 [Amycolatopsis marina]|uniref:Excreted virulence factor EspC, type VII ESX diderm n=1 Tax=Amycolatopsis marina TaxID=490629 RepID=A0A1I1CQF1_9PSEU|nr:hypothetical protein [Amycolatopsis marina]SFB64949.1 hypothetical protein SAMN05216266_1514 [Amycolatopsis marina]